MKTKLIALLSLPFLFACSGHPAAASWSLANSGAATIETINVEFEGRATLTQSEAHGGNYHCFWNARSAQMIALKCSLAGEDDQEYHFELAVDEQGRAALSQNETLLATYKKATL